MDKWACRNVLIFLTTDCYNTCSRTIFACTDTVRARRSLCRSHLNYVVSYRNVSYTSIITTSDTRCIITTRGHNYATTNRDVSNSSMHTTANSCCIHATRGHDSSATNHNISAIDIIATTDAGGLTTSV